MKRTVSKTNPSENFCEAKFKPLTVPTFGNQNMFILGNTFMQLFYTIVDRKTDQVGFAKAIHTTPEIVDEFNTGGFLDQMLILDKKEK